jgi:hypothetical protein
MNLPNKLSMPFVWGRASGDIKTAAFSSSNDVSLIVLGGAYPKCLPVMITDRLESKHSMPYEVSAAAFFSSYIRNASSAASNSRSLLARPSQPFHLKHVYQIHLFIGPFRGLFEHSQLFLQLYDICIACRFCVLDFQLELSPGTIFRSEPLDVIFHETHD